MRKNVKNDKVIRATTIGLAAMIAATSAPISVLAEEGDGGSESDPVESHESNESGGSDTPSESHEESHEEYHVEASAASYDTVMLMSAPAPAPVEETVDPAPVIVAEPGLVPVRIDDIDNNLTDDNGELKLEFGITPETAGELGKVATELGYVKTDIDNLKNDLGYNKDNKTIASSDFKNITDEEKKEFADPFTFTDAKEGIIDKGDQKGDHYILDENGEKKTDANGDPYVITESTAPQLKDFYDEYTQAVKNLEELGDPNKPLDAADFNEKLQDAKDFADKADKKLKAAENTVKDLKAAIKDTKAAEAAVQAAQQKLDLLKAISEQYDAFIQSFVNDNISSKVEKIEDGKINLKGDTLTAAETQQLKGNTYPLGRGLLEEIVTYDLKYDFSIPKGLDPDGEYEIKDIKFGEMEGNGQDQKQKDVIDNDPNTDDKQWWVAPGGNETSGDYGRNHCVKVTYNICDTDGNVVKSETKYYNYIIKASDDKFEGTTLNNGQSFKEDFAEAGPIFVAEVIPPEESEDGKWHYQAYESDDRLSNNFMDNYTSIQSAYEDSKKEVDAAAKQVSELKQQIGELGFSITGDDHRADYYDPDSQTYDYDSYLNDLLNQLNDAQDNLEANRKEMDMLRELLGRYEKKNIPNPNPNPNPQPGPGDDDDDDGEATPPGDVIYEDDDITVIIPTSEIIPPAADATPAIPALTAFALPTSGVAGVRVDEPATATPRMVASVKTPVISNKKTATKNPKLVKLEDNEVPLAEMPEEDGFNMSWWWLLIIFLLGATGKAMYDKHKKKVEEAKADDN